MLCYIPLKRIWNGGIIELAYRNGLPTFITLICIRYFAHDIKSFDNFVSVANQFRNLLIFT